MITDSVIKEIYKKFSKRPSSIDELNMVPLFEAAHKSHGIGIEDDKIIIGSFTRNSIFRSIPLKNVNAILEFENHIAIVLHSSIIFLSKNDNGSYIHFKPVELSLWDKFKGAIGRRK